MATAPNGSICLEWDLAGRRTKTIYPTSNCTDGNDFFVSYENYLGR